MVNFVTSFHERAVKADKEAREHTKKMLLKKYPYIDLSRFKILTHIDGDAKAHPEVVFMDKSSGRESDLHMDKLNVSGKEALFPIIWSSVHAGAALHTLPEGRAHGRSAENR